MDHEPVLISTIAIGLTAAFIGGFVARRIGLPAIVGYIVAGIVIGPFTPGIAADPDHRDPARRDRRHPPHVRRRDPLLVPGSPRRPRDRRTGRGRADRRRHDPRDRARRPPRIRRRGRARARPRDLRREHGRPAARSRGPQRAGHPARPHRGRLADRRGPLHGRRPRAAPAHRTSTRRDRWWDPCRDLRGRRGGPRGGRLRHRSRGDLRRRHGRRGRAGHPVAPAAGRAPGVTGAVHAGGPCDRAGNRLRRVDGLRCVLRARRIPGRSRRERVGHESSGGRRRPSTA